MNSRNHPTMHLTEIFLGNMPGKTLKGKQSKERFFIIKLARKYL
jgi:hypothetical protein